MPLVPPVAIALVAIVAAGCGSAQASHPGTAASTPAPSTPAASTPPHTTPATLTITLAGNQKTYTLKVGEKLHVYLLGTRAQRWLPPSASGIAVAPIVDPAGTLQIGVTGGAFAAVQPGRAILTSVRPPCRVMIPQNKADTEPASPPPTPYPVQACGPGRRFTVTINVLR
jgi:hypothetical protein